MFLLDKLGTWGKFHVLIWRSIFYFGSAFFCCITNVNIIRSNCASFYFSLHHGMPWKHPSSKIQNQKFKIITLIWFIIVDTEEDEIDLVYAERNVLQEEATTVEAETITVDRFRQRFIGTVDRTTYSPGSHMLEVANGDSKSEHPKYKAPPPPPRQRRTSSSSTTIKVL